MWVRLRKFVSRFWPQPPVISLSADNVGVTIERSGQAEPVLIRWDDVDEIQTFKADLGIVDDIRIALRVRNGWYQLSEENRGFMDVTEAMQRKFPSIPKGWYFEVMHPAFATNQRVLWCRSEETS
jgi:hypothetical protein